MISDTKSITREGQARREDAQSPRARGADGRRGERRRDRLQRRGGRLTGAGESEFELRGRCRWSDLVGHWERPIRTMLEQRGRRSVDGSDIGETGVY